MFESITTEDIRNYRFNVCDLNAIETRVGAWLAECPALMDVFVPYTDAKGNFWRNGRDPYLSFASKMFGIPYEKLWADYQGWNGKEAKSKAKAMRQIAKPGVLGAIYRLSGGLLMYIFKCIDCGYGYITPDKGNWHCPKCDSDNPGEIQYTKKTGLWDYADKMNVEMSQKQATEVVSIFRTSYPEICNTNPNDGPLGIWKRLEDAVADVMHPDHPATVRYIGPNNAVRIDRVNLGHTDSMGNYVQDRHPIMRMRLPSGRYLHYLDAHLAQTKMPWMKLDEDGEEIPVYKDSLIYAGTNQKTKQWENNTYTHGGKEFENLVQGIARDVLGVKLLAFEAAGMPVVGHVHDEGVTLVPNDIISPTVHDMVDIMSTPIDWAPGLLLGADGYEDPYYHK
jgi:DNA polymerase bacteriophage-type